MRPESATPRLRFGDFEIDTESRELFRAGERVDLQDKPFEVLTMLLERPHEIVTREELRDRLWHGQIVEFDNNLNTALAKVRRALGDTTTEPRWVETVPKRGYRWIGKIESEARPRSWLTWLAAIAVPVALAAIMLAVYGRSAQTGAPRADGPATAKSVPAPERSLLVVLPFVSPGGDDELADTWTEELITRLAQRLPREIGVIARTSAMRFKDRALDLRDLGDELGVRYVLEGSLAATSGGLKITARLIGVEDQAHLWAASFDDRVDELPQIQEAIAAGIASELDLSFETAAPISPASTSEEAWRAYLQGRRLLQPSDGEGRSERIETAVAILQQAVELDPSFAQAWSALAEALHRGRGSGESSWIESRDAARRALRLDPDLVEPRLRLAQTALYREWDWEAADQQLREASRLAPNLASVNHVRAGWLSTQGRHREALAEIDRALVLDPLSVVLHADAGWYFYVARRYEDALARCAEALELEPEHRGANWYRLRSLLALERHADAGRQAAKLLVIEGADAPAIERARQDPESAIPGLFELRRDRLQAAVDSGLDSEASLALAYLDLGEPAEGQRLLVAGADRPGAWIYPFLAVYPPLDALRGEKVFRELVERVGVPGGGPAQSSGR